MRFRYKYEHLDCACCLELEGGRVCPHELCPHILNNLDDLSHDPAFHAAVRYADRCGSFHRPALLYLQDGRQLCPV